MEIRKEEYEYLSKYLEDGEQILWTGKPDKKNNFSVWEILYTLASALLYIASIFGIIATAGEKMYMELFLLAIFHFFICPYMLFGRFIVAKIIKSHTAYIITDRRLIRKCCKRVTMLYGRYKILPMRLYYTKNGNITVCFGRKRWRDYYRGITGIGFWGYGFNFGETFAFADLRNITSLREAVSKMKEEN